MKKILAVILCIVLYITGKSFAESDELLNAAIVIFSGSFVLYMKDNYYDIKSIIITFCIVIAGTLFFIGENLFFIFLNCFTSVLYLAIAGTAEFNTCELFFAIFRKRKTKIKRLEFDSCNQCHYHDMKFEAGDCRLFGLIPTGIKWSEKACSKCNHFQQGELSFLRLKINYGILLGFYKATK